MRTTVSLLATTMLLAASASAIGQLTLTRITNGVIVTDVGGGVRGAWGDFNNDGFLDLFVSSYESTNLLYLNNGDGTFTKITQRDPVRDTDAHTGAALGDYDNDGNLDLLVSSGSSEPTAHRSVLYHGNGDGTFSRAGGGSITNQAGYFGACAWADIENKGLLDLFITDHGGNDNGAENLLFHNNGDGTFTKAASGSLTSDIAVGWADLWADYDNDGFMDLLVVNNAPNAVNFLYHNNRNGTFSRVLTNIIASDRWPQGGVSGAWEDYDNDGFPDLFVVAGGGDQNRLYHNNGDGTFRKLTSGPMFSRPVGAKSNACAWGDYDNDGFLDLFVASSVGNSQLFHNNGNGTFTEILSGDPVTEGEGNRANWVDYDNDGFLDLFVTGARNRLYHNGGNRNAWLEVKCVGTVSNRSAIGAKVRVRATVAGKAVWQLRELNDEAVLVAHFGLGQATNVEVLRIEWPSGIVQEFQPVASNQILTVTEPSRMSVSMAAGVPQFSLQGRRGFQYQLESSTNLLEWSKIGALGITNLNRTVPIIDTNPAASDRKFYRAAR